MERYIKDSEKNEAGNAKWSTTDGMKIDVNALITHTEGYPVIKVPLEPYLYKLNQDCWTDENGLHITPLTVAESIIEHGYKEATRLRPELARHIQDIEHANYSFPIHEYEHNIINGAHRLTKLYIDRMTGISKQDFITVRRLRAIPPEAIVSTKSPE